MNYLWHHPRSPTLSTDNVYTSKNPLSFPVSAFVVFPLPKLSFFQLQDDPLSAKGRGVGHQPVSVLGVQEDLPVADDVL